MFQLHVGLISSSLDGLFHCTVLEALTNNLPCLPSYFGKMQLKSLFSTKYLFFCWFFVKITIVRIVDFFVDFLSQAQSVENCGFLAVPRDPWRFFSKLLTHLTCLVWKWKLSSGRCLKVGRFKSANCYDIFFALWEMITITYHFLPWPSVTFVFWSKDLKSKQFFQDLIVVDYSEIFKIWLWLIQNEKGSQKQGVGQQQKVWLRLDFLSEEENCSGGGGLLSSSVGPRIATAPQ